MEVNMNRIIQLVCVYVLCITGFGVDAKSITLNEAKELGFKFIQYELNESHKAECTLIEINTPKSKGTTNDNESRSIELSIYDRENSKLISVSYFDVYYDKNAEGIIGTACIPLNERYIVNVEMVFKPGDHEVRDKFSYTILDYKNWIKNKK